MTNWPTRLAACLDPHEDGAKTFTPARSDYDLNTDVPRMAPVKRAAVLVPLIERASGWQVLLTRRTRDMPSHAGQIAFPGGQAGKDECLISTALREFEEETGINQSCATMLGRFERYETATGFDITPFVAVLQTPIAPRPDPREVDEVFEVPFDFLMDVSNHQRKWMKWQGQRRYFYAMPWNEYFIWGATAGMLHALALRVGGQNDEKDDPCCV